VTRDAGTAPEDRVPIEVREEAVTPEFKVAPVNVPAAAVTVMSPEPLKATPLMFLEVWRVVAVSALPEIEPVMVLVDVRLVKMPLVEKKLVEVAWVVVALVAIRSVTPLRVVRLFRVVVPAKDVSKRAWV